MNAFALTSLYRSLTRHKLYAALNIGGLAVGIAVFLVLALYVRFENSFEKWLPRHDGIYVMRTIWNIPGSSFNGPAPFTMGGMLEQIREDIPGVVGTRIRGGDEGGVVHRGGVATTEDVAQVDGSFFDVFDLPMVRGRGRGALARPNTVLISDSIARKYFGTTDPIGQTMTIAVDEGANYRVAGVFRDVPANSDLVFSMLVPLPRKAPSENWFNWGSNSLQTFLRFDTPEAARAFEGKLPALARRRGTELGPDPWQVQRLDTIPLTRMHLEPVGLGSASRKITVVTLGLVGILTLLIAVVNYVNLATARAGLRAREVAMRKVLGADRKALIRQFLGEAMLTVAVAALLGLVLAELGLPLVNAAGGLSLTFPYALVGPMLVGLIVVVGVLAGLYPAVLLARYPAASVLASARSPGGGRASTRTREALVILQFGLAIAFMIGTAVLVAQTRHVRQSDVGFNREGLMLVLSTRDSLVDAGQRRSFLAALRDLPGVTGVTAANDAPAGSGERNSENVPMPGIDGGNGPSVRWITVGPDFFEVHQARLLAGRTFSDRYRTDDSLSAARGQARAIVINRGAVAKLGFKTPQEAVGKTVGGSDPRTIIGVIDDMRFDSPRDPKAASIYYYAREPEKISTMVVVARHTGDPRAMIDATRQLWQRMVPQVPFNANSAERRMIELYQDDDRATRLFGIGAGLAVLIGCVGLWGLAAFNTQRRVKEIGIRKTLGASSGDIVRLLVGQFLRPVLIANLVAWPLAYVAMRTWLAGFDDRIALSPLFFVGASVLAIVIAVLTVLGQALRASRAAPAWALRHD